MSTTSEKYRFILSHELDHQIRIRIITAECEKTFPSQPVNGIFYSNNSLFPPVQVHIICQIYSDGKALSSPVQTAPKLFTTDWTWNEWLTLPLRYCDLPRHALLALSIHQMNPPGPNRIIASTTLSLFDTDGTYRRGIHELSLWLNVPPDVKWNSTTPGKGDLSKSATSSTMTNQQQNNVPTVKPIITTANLQQNPPQVTLKPIATAWNEDSAYPMLDELSRMAKLIKTRDTNQNIQQDWIDQWVSMKSPSSFDRERLISISVEFGDVFTNDTESIVLYFQPNTNDVLNYPIGYTDLPVYDPDLDLENIDETKYSKLSRSARKALNKDLRPSSEHFTKLMQILFYPPGQIFGHDEQEIIWKYRFFLSQYKKALPKILQCVHWDREEETKQALELLEDWPNLDIEDALTLLGPNFQHPQIRSYAVTRLRQTTNDELLLYLLQMVQALRYERNEPMHSPSMGNENENNELNDIHSNSIVEVDLASFLIERSCTKAVIANYLYWYVSVECENNSSSKDKTMIDMYQAFLNRLMINLKTKNEQTFQVWEGLDAQKRFVEKLIELIKIVKRTTGSSQQKEKKLRQLLLEGDDSPVKFNFLHFDPIPLPLDPDVMITGIDPERVKIFPSAKLPVLFVFETIDGGEYPTIFKTGDDLRQDQLILQIISLMDRILRKENIDLKLTSYKVLSTSLRYGFVQYIPSQALREILERHRTIRQYLQSRFNAADHQDDPTFHQIGLPLNVIDAYVKSCAGYSVITYLLGVGDRHLDNLLLRDTGQLFHVDFSFILGRDPKPLPQPMRISKDMIEMLDGNRFLEFLQYSFKAFLTLRKHANVLANSFSLMLDANIPDIAAERDKTVKKFLDKFRLDLDDEKAISYLKDLIDSSISAIVPQVYEYFHRLLVAFR